MMETSNLKNLKENYQSFQKKYDLPSFDELNRDFKIEKLADAETDFLLREIRSQISEILENFLGFVGLLLNPVNLPMFLFPVVKSFGSDEKEKLSKLHKDLSKLIIYSMKLINYSEEGEVEFIKKAFSLWQVVKKDFSNLFENIENKLESKSEKKNNGYFG